MNDIELCLKLCYDMSDWKYVDKETLNGKLVKIQSA